MTDQKDDAAPEEADVPPTRKHEALPPSPRIDSSAATYVKGYERHDGRLAIDGPELVFSTKRDRKGAFALFGVLGLLAKRFEPLLTIPLVDIKQVSGTPGGFEVETAKETMKFQVASGDRTAWIERLSASDLRDPPARESHLSIAVEPTRFPDDGPLSRSVRLVDHALGMLEQALLFALLAAVVLTAAAAALSDKVLHDPIGRWWFTIVRGGTFAIGMFGAVFATHQQRHLAMDLISRRLSPRGRLVLGTLLKLFTIGIAMLLFRSGLHQRDTVGGAGDEFISDKTIVTTLPIAAALIILHSVLHIVIDLDYLVRGKLPPEPARSGH